MARILVVCTANICRSPVAEAILRDSLLQAGLSDWEVASAGTWAYPGQAAATYSVEVLGERGMSIDDHRSRLVDEALLSEADLILCMEHNHAEALRAEFPQHAERILLLTQMAGHNYSVNDPYGGTRDDYVRMVREVTSLIDEGLPAIIGLAQAHAGERTV
jgi:protein-tyrosine phosphatase